MNGPVFDFHARITPAADAADRLLAMMDSYGIERAAVSAGGILRIDTLSRQLTDGGYVTTDADNTAVLEACSHSRNRLVPFYFANPHRAAELYQEQSALWQGLEISPAVHGIGLTDVRIRALVEIATQLRHPVYTVCLQRTGCTVSDLVALAAEVPAGTFVLGHAGIGNIDFHALNLIADQPNVLVETSGGYTTVAQAALDRLGRHRVLFGTEYPMQHPAVELAKFAALGLEPECWHEIAWRNAHRVLGQECS